LPHYATLGRRLIQESGARLIVLGSPKERPLVKQLCGALNGAAVAAVTGLETAAAIINGLDVLVTPDTGPMHMAFALRRPAVALFGPTNPVNFGPLADPEKHRVLHKAALDRPMIKLAGDPVDRIGLITPGEVYGAAINLLAAGSQTLTPTANP
jgi:ADP-heptose:LPS heptosyltransferase